VDSPAGTADVQPVRSVASLRRTATAATVKLKPYEVGPADHPHR
jgi:hypothetical protein